MSWKVNGRIGDSPIIGAGLYVDNDIGAAGATGRGEDVIKSCASFYIVLRMGQRRTPQEACEDACELIFQKYRNVNPNFFPSEKFVAINKDGEYGAASMGNSRGRPRMTIRNDEGLAPPISLDSRLAKTAGPERKGRDGPEAEGEQGDRRS